MSDENQNLLDMTVSIVAAYVENNSVPASELPSLIASTHSTLARLGAKPETPAAEPLVPAVPIRKSVTPNAIICLEDGKSFKSLKRHLFTKFGMTPDQYRAKWGLPADYPMVAPAYAEARSALAKTLGLGRLGSHTKKPSAAAAAS